MQNAQWISCHWPLPGWRAKCYDQRDVPSFQSVCAARAVCVAMQALAAHPDRPSRAPVLASRSMSLASFLYSVEPGSFSASVNSVSRRSNPEKTLSTETDGQSVVSWKGMTTEIINNTPVIVLEQARIRWRAVAHPLSDDAQG